MSALILLGAGASFGSKNVKPTPPPLGNQLFTELLKKGGEAAKMPQDIQERFSIDFEDGMAEYFKFKCGNIMAFQRELAQYLASFQPLKGNVYIDLIDSLKPQRVIYSSLNYDLLFEQSAARLGLNTSYKSTYKDGGVRLLKIHGSSNFWPDTDGFSMKGCTFVNQNSLGADYDGAIKPLNQKDTLKKCVVEDSLAPAMAMFSVGKNIRVCPKYVDKQYIQWKAEAEKASKVFIIGVRVHEVDKHIWEVLGQVGAKLYYFGFEGDRAEFYTWKEHNNKVNAYFRLAGFEQSVDMIKTLV